MRRILGVIIATALMTAALAYPVAAFPPDSNACGDAAGPHGALGIAIADSASGGRVSC